MLLPPTIQPRDDATRILEQLEQQEKEKAIARSGIFVPAATNGFLRPISEENSIKLAQQQRGPGSQGSAAGGGEAPPSGNVDVMMGGSEAGGSASVGPK